MKLNSLLALTFGLMIFLAISLGAYSIYRFYSISHYFDTFYNHPYTVRPTLLNLSTAVDEIRDLWRECIIFSEDSSKLASSVEEVETLKESARSDIEILRKEFLGDPKLVDAIESNLERWYAIEEKIPVLLADGKKDEAIRIASSRENTEPLQKFHQAIEACNNFAINKAKQIHRQRQDSVIEARNTTILSSFIVSAIGIFIAWILLRHVKIKLGKDPAELARIAADVSTGNFHYDEAAIPGSVHAQLMGIIENCERFQEMLHFQSTEIARGKLKPLPIGVEAFTGGWRTMCDQVSSVLENLTLYLDQFPTPIVIVDGSMRIIYNNEASTFINSLSSSDNSNQPQPLLCDSLCDGNCLCIQSMLLGIPCTGETCINIDGESNYFSVYSIPIFDNDKLPVGAAAIFTDITKQVVALEDLRKSESLFKDAEQIGNIGSFEWFLDVDQAALSDNAYRIFGYEIGASITNDEFSELIHPDDLEYYRETRQIHIKTEEPVTFRIRCYHYTTGELRHVEFCSGIGKRNKKGKVLSIRGIVADVTEREDTKRALAAQNQYIMSILDSLPVGIAVNSRNKPYTSGYVNQQFLQLFNLGSQVPKSINEFWERAFPDEAFRKEFRELVEADLASGDPERMHWEKIPITENDGNVKYITAKYIPLSQGELIVVWDVDIYHKTLQAAVESKHSAESAYKAKSVFLANMSHEIRTPLNVVLGFAQLLTENVNDIQRRDYAQAIQTAGNALLELINDILEISKIEFSNIVLRPRPTSIDDILDGLYTLFYQSANEKKLKFTVSTLENIPPLIIDGPRLRQVLINFIGNAIKFTEEGSISVHSQCEVFENKCSLSISVSDTGIGIEPDQFTRVFQLFQQQDSQDISRYGGTGLGLAISKHITELMGGSIHLESCPGKGSTFTLRLENLELADTIEFKPTVKPIALPTRFKPSRALIVDDIASNQIVLSAMLHGLGFEVDTAENGKTALEMTDSGQWDIILTDQRMPVMDGMEFARQVRNISTMANIPIVVVTATHEIESLETSGLFNDILPKPINRNRLVSILAKHIDALEESV